MQTDVMDLKREIRKEVEQNNGRLTLDTRNKKHMDYMLEILGGEDKLKQTSPGIYSLLNKQGEGLISLEEEAKDGLCDSLKVRNLAFVGQPADSRAENSSQYRITTNVSASYVNNKNTVIIKIEIWDVEMDRAIYTDQSNVALQDDNMYYKTFICDIYDNLPKDGKLYQVLISSVKLGENKYREAILGGDISSFSEVYISNPEDIVDEFKTIDPVVSRDINKDRPEYKERTKDKIVVVYQREGELLNYDYHSDENLIIGSGDTEQVKVWLPVKFSLSVKEGFFIGQTDETGKLDTKAGYLNKAAGFQVELERVDKKGGVVHHYCNFEEIVQKVEVFDNQGWPKRVTWSLPEHWNDVLQRQGLSGRFTGADIYARFYALISKKGSKMPVSTTLIMQSLMTTPTKTSINSKELYIQWGCLEENTLILMADGTKKPIKELKIGEMVYSAEKKPARIIDIYHGKDSHIWELTGKGGNRLLASRTHPVITETGPKRMHELKAGDLIQTVDKKEEILSITELAEEVVVYNLQFEEETCFFGNGFTVGDYDMQQEMESSRMKQEKKEFAPGTIALGRELRQLANGSSATEFIGCTKPESFGLHYFSVKTIALLTGFSEEDAQRIAEYSQFTGDQAANTNIYVDSIIEEVERLCEKTGSLWKVPIYATAMKDWTDLNEVSKPSVQQKVLVPFHYYAPESMPENAQEDMSEEDNGYRVEYYPSRLKKLIEDVAEAYKAAAAKKDEGKRQTCLMQLGILLHILADTYLHQNLCGIDNWRNNILLKAAKSDISYTDLMTKYQWETGQKVNPVGHTKIKYACNDSWVNYIYTYPMKPDEIIFSGRYTCRNITGMLPVCKDIYKILSDCLNKEPTDDSYWESTIAPVLEDGLHQESNEFSVLKASWTRRYPGGSYHYDGTAIFKRLIDGKTEHPKNENPHEELFRYILFADTLKGGKEMLLKNDEIEKKASITLVGIKQTDDHYVIKPKKGSYTLKVKAKLPMFTSGFSYLNLELYDVESDRVILTTNNSHKGSSVTAIMETDKKLIDCKKSYILRASFSYEEKDKVLHKENKDFKLVFSEK